MRKKTFYILSIRVQNKCAVLGTSVKLDFCAWVAHCPSLVQARLARYVHVRMYHSNTTSLLDTTLRVCGCTNEVHHLLFQLRPKVSNGVVLLCHTSV